MPIPVHLVHSLIDGAAGGNPAGVVIAADTLGTAQKLAIAARVGLSETAFVSRSACATVKLEFFTPTRQIAHCGHATIAAFSLLRDLGRIGSGPATKETIDGTRRIQVDTGRVLMEQRAPVYTEVAPESALGRRVAASLGLAAGQPGATLAPVVVDTGNAFLMVALPDAATVASVQPVLPLVAAVSEELGLVGYYLFSRETRQAGRQAGTRMFAPRYGIDEESATGTAAGPLACLLHDRLGVAQTAIRIEQGWLMRPPSPSVIEVELETQDGRIAGLMAGGAARLDRVIEVQA